MHAFNEFREQLEHLKKVERFRSLNAWRTDGIYLIAKDSKELCNFGSNDYLGFAARNHESHRCGSGASALVSGWSNLHQDLAADLSLFESKDAVCVFPSGYAASSGTVSTLTREGDLILSDELNHASLIDGCRLSKASCLIYPHRDMSALRELLRAHRHRFKNAWIVTDSVFSMDGHLAPLNAICDLRDEFDAAVIIDEAHATGVLGENGSGLAEWLNVKHRVDVVIGTLSKAIGSHGGFVASSQTVVDYLINRCRPMIYSTALPQSSVLAATASVKRIRANPSERDHVKSLAQTLRESLGLDASKKEMLVPIVPVVVGSDELAVSLSKQLSELGFYIPAIRPPTVPEGLARLRISLSALHTHKMLENLIQHLLPLIQDLDIGKLKKP
ncbi:MAG: aminotransferase class I/II-fold pyridoxal phosphate-dependent enzyme [Rubripirellula sp.]